MIRVYPAKGQPERGKSRVKQDEDKVVGDSGGAYLRQLRQERGVSIMSLAGICSITYRTLQEIESGETTRPGRSTLLAILKGLSGVKKLGPNERNKVLEPFGYRDQSLLPENDEVATIARQWERSVFELPHPAYLVDFAHRFIAWNRYAPRVIGLTYGHPALEKMRGRTLFDLIFDRQFETAFAIKNKDTFVPEMLYVMRCEFEPFKDDEWCKECIRSAKATHPQFRAIWDKVQKMPVQELGLRTMGPIITQAAGGEELSFHLLGTDFVNDSRFRVIQYLPANAATMRQCLEWVEGEERRQGS